LPIKILPCALCRVRHSAKPCKVGVSSSVC
jgi:hypothetical protein